MKNYFNNPVRPSLTMLIALFMLTIQPFTGLGQSPSADAILQSFADSYKNDPMAMDATFGIKVGEDWWNVTVKRAEKPYAVGKNKQYTFHEFGPNAVTLRKGKPAQPTWYFRCADRATLDKINDKVWTASTAATKSTPSDQVSFDIEDMEGYKSTQQATALAYLTLEHFWKKDAVEITEFARDSSLPSHGAAIVSLYTMKDKRIAWVSLGKEEAANNDRGLDKGQVPNLLIITRGKGKATIGEQDLDLKPGMSVFIPPYVKHVFYNPNDEPLEGILVLFGDNIDYALGQSYISFLEKEYDFYGQNEKAVSEMK